MPRRIDVDHKDFLDVYGGKIRKELKKFKNNGRLIRRPKNGKSISVTLPRIDIPHIVYGDPTSGIGRAPVKPGDVIGRDDDQGKGPKAGEEHQDGIEIEISLEYILKFLKDELELPDLKPKSQEVFQDVKIKYNDISRIGPNSLRHNKKTILQAMKRMSATGELNELHELPGFAQPMRQIIPNRDDFRYRKYKEIKIPSNNAVIFFARDGSASMDADRCDVVSDMCWWIEVWIKRFYKKTETCYMWHDTIAEEVSQDKFYRYRSGGGTKCSSALDLISHQFENRFPSNKWNIYVFYFSDGDNWGDDNQTFCEILKNKFTPDVVNLFALTQVAPWYYENSLGAHVAQTLMMDNLVLANIGANGISSDFFSSEERDKQVLEAIKKILGKKVS